MQTLELVTAIMTQIRTGEITKTIRHGEKSYEQGPLCFDTPDQKDRQSVFVESVEIMPFKELSSEHIKAAGATSPTCLMDQMLTFYPTLNEDSLVTVISWERVLPEY